MRFLNTISQIIQADHINPIIGILRHLFWQVGKVVLPNPWPLTISDSIVRINGFTGVGALINCLGMYDYNNMNLIKLLLTSSELNTFIDVGANVGVYSLIASEIPQSQVHAFEPHPVTYSILENNISRNFRQNVIPHQIALSDADGVSFISDFNEPAINRLQNNTGIQVQSNRLDRIVRENRIEPHVVKIDVEGAELEVLRGMGQAINRTVALIIEHGERDEIYEYLSDVSFEGPLYFHFRNGVIDSCPQSRREDAIYLSRKHLSLISQVIKSQSS